MSARTPRGTRGWGILPGSYFEREEEQFFFSLGGVIFSLFFALYRALAVRQVVSTAVLLLLHQG